MYLTYDQYSDFGGTLDEATFEQFEFEARAVIDWWTFNRLKNETEYPEAVKYCTYKLINLFSDRAKVTSPNIYNADGSVKAGIASESNDGVSTSYNTLSAKEAVDVSDKDMYLTIRMYLSDVRNSLGQKILYRGLYPNE